MPCGPQKRVIPYGIWHLEAYPLQLCSWTWSWSTMQRVLNEIIQIHSEIDRRLLTGS